MKNNRFNLNLLKMRKDLEKVIPGKDGYNQEMSKKTPESSKREFI